MSAMDELTDIAQRALWISCMESNCPVQVTDPRTIERVAALLRSGPETKQAPASTPGLISCDETHSVITHRNAVPSNVPNAANIEKARYEE